MNSKLDDFVARLSDPDIPEDQQSFILTTDDTKLTGGDNVQGNCSNADATACSGTNDRCTNEYGACGTSTNRSVCINKGRNDGNNPGSAVQ
jgi:hypothetical protein